MDYLMDTNSVSAMLKQNEKNENIWEKVALVEFTDEKIFLSTITYYETWVVSQSSNPENGKL